MLWLKNTLKNGRRAITFIEILVASVIFAIAFMPISSIIFKTTKKTHEMNFEVTAERIAQNLLDQVLKNVRFEDVTPNMTVGLGTSGSMINLDMNKATIAGNVITQEKVDYKYEFEITNIKAGDIKMSFVQFKNNTPPWSSSQKSTGTDGISKMDETTFVNFDIKKLIGGNADLVVMKTVKLKMSWKNSTETAYNDPTRCFVFVTRKAKIDGSIN
ncbi:MAG TPA: hypothetical protein PKK26_03925 [Candidatus Wallbacteria bacterium]|nr:hypothetical protein [Candidatus Wallbacteria bacterium]